MRLKTANNNRKAKLRCAAEAESYRVWVRAAMRYHSGGRADGIRDSYFLRKMAQRPAKLLFGKAPEL